MARRLFSVLICLSMLLSCFACGNGEKKPNGDGNGSAELKAWTMHGYEKTVVGMAPKGDLSTDYTVYLSKGETEGCQVAVYSSEMLKSVTLSMKSGETKLIKPAMFSMEKTHAIGRRQYTDSLIPYGGGRLILHEKTVLPFMIEFTTDENTPAGDYEYVYEFKDREKNVLATFNITVHVWDFELPKDKTFATGAALHWRSIAVATGLCNEEIYKQWYDMMLEHNISAFDLPYDELDERADAYMSDPRVTSFILPIPENEDGTINEEELLKYYNKLKTNPVWLEKAFFWPIDEPRDREMLDRLREMEKKLTALCPEIEICAPYYTNIRVGEGKDQTEEMAEYTDLWCPKLCLWDDERSYGDFDISYPKSFEERMKEQQANGDRVWTYVCNDPDDPYAQLFIDTEGKNQRLMFWQMYQRDIEGFLYWAVNYYGYKEGPHFEGNGTQQNPWHTVNTKIPNGQGKTIYGCGFLFYPGSDVGISGPVPSIRAKIVRDGCDDIEMLRFAEQYLGKEWLIEKTKEGTPTLTKYASSDKFTALRIEIGNAIEAAIKANQ
ncbi:MAG: DUF4091 domain-containing protein [Clostridia bacterium]|nr:DUF4091 domain-containing protein [Clostridia bacterium]